MELTVTKIIIKTTLNNVFLYTPGSWSPVSRSLGANRGPRSKYRLRGVPRVVTTRCEHIGSPPKI